MKFPSVFPRLVHYLLLLAAVLAPMAHAQEKAPLAEPLFLPDAEVPGYRLEAEEFVTSPKSVVADAGVSGGRAVRETRRMILLNMPFPLTSLPVHVYLRVRAEDESALFNLESYHGGEKKRIAQTTAKTAGEWHWIKFPPVSSSEVGKQMRIDAVPGRNSSGQPAAIDTIVVSTRPGLGADALAEVRPLFPPGPLARVARTAQAPEIDARPDDPCWSQSVAINDFARYDNRIPAVEATTARLAYDDRNLYILMVCEESLLRVADMRQEEIVARVTDRDKTKPWSVLGDDACFLLLQPREGGPVYEFAVNTVGALLDARTSPEDLWKSRDAGWNASVKAAVMKGDGAWTVEMAIPLTDLGVDKIEEGQQWKSVIARFAAGRKEYSSWNPSGAGAHEPKEWGRLLFSTQPVGLSPEARLTTLEPGINTLEAKVQSSLSGINLMSIIHPPETKPVIAGTAFAPHREAFDAEHAFEVKAAGVVDARWAALDSGSMQPFYLSPSIHSSVQSSSVTLLLDSAAPYQVTVNDHLVAKGNKADHARIKIRLRAGANVVAVRAESGPIGAAIEGPGMEPLSNTWRLGDAADPKAASSALDDRAWPLAIPGKEGKFEKGDEGGFVLRRTLLLDKTVIWPVPHPAVYVAGGSTQHVNFKVNGLKGKILDDWTTWFAVPDGLTLVGSTGYYGNHHETQPTYEFHGAGETTIDGKRMSLFKVRASKPLRFTEHNRMSLFQVMFSLEDENATEGSAWTVHYWTQADGGSVAEGRRSFEVRALPALRGRQPEKFVTQLWGSSFNAMDSEPLRRATLATMQAAGLNQIVSNDLWTSEVGKEYGVTTQLNVNFKPHSIGLECHLKDHPEERLIAYNGKPDDQRMCTSLLVGERWPVAAGIFAGIIRERKAASVSYDYEIPPWTGAHACFCPRCLLAFRERAGLPADETLTPRIIEDHYRGQWEEYMAWRGAHLLLKMKNTVHESAPGITFDTYCVAHSPRTVSVYGLDWGNIGTLKAVDVASFGTGDPEAVRETIRLLDGIPRMTGVWIRPYGPSDMIPGQVVTPARYLRRALYGNHGVLVYDRNTMDGRSWRGIAETTRLISEFEELFLGNQVSDVPGQDPEKVKLLTGSRASLLCVMNPDGREESFSIALPGEMGVGREFYRGETVEAGALIKVRVPAGETVVYVFGDNQSLATDMSAKP